MQVKYKNKRLETVLIGVNVLAAALVTTSFVLLFGFDEPLLPAPILYSIQFGLLFAFIAEKIVRLFNSVSVKEYFHANWFEIALLAALLAAIFTAGRWVGIIESQIIRNSAVGIYLVVQVVTKLCKTSVNMAASGKNPTRALILSFLFLIISGAGLLCLPRSSAAENIGFVDALFTSTSATCVTGLIVKDTGRDFSLMGQIVILSLIQLGGLGIVIFGAVFALLMGQAISLRERVAMQDLLSAQTLNRIINMIAFIFVGTVLIEALGASSLFRMWDNVPSWTGNIHQQWFYSIFHSISAFCNAGFSLFSDSFVRYNRCMGVYLVVCPLIILGGLGFGVLYDIANVLVDSVKRFFKKCFRAEYRLSMEAPKKMQLQTKIVFTISLLLIVFGTMAILFFDRFTPGGSNTDWSAAFFQSVTARTAGFNTVDISQMSPSSRFVLILLMFIGGSPGSTAGGIKTVTFAVVIMTAIATLRKRQEVEMFKRSIRLVIVGRAITVTLLFIAVLFIATLALAITENQSNFDLSQIFFETASALGTVGLTTGITPSLTNAGKLIIIAVMLIGRLGPLTLLAALTFDLKPVRYDYPQEAIVVG